MYVYVITNKINHKKYVGITTKTIEERWKEHIRIAFSNSKDSKALFKKAIKKYGVENWLVEELEQCENIEQLKEREQYWIKILNSYAFDENGWGYNSTRGGDLPPEFTQTPVCICDILQGTILFSCDSIKKAEKITGVRIEKIGEPDITSGGYCILYQKQLNGKTQEEIKNIIQDLYPHLVYQLDLQGNIVNLYRNTVEASKTINCSNGNLIMACQGKRRLCHGFQWAYRNNLKDKIYKQPRDIKTLAISVTQYSLGGIKIREWNSITEAVKNNRGTDSHISQCCNGKRQSCGGFQWRYTEDEITQLPPLFNKRKVQCIETQEIFETPNHAAKHFNYAQQTIKKSCMNNGKISKPFHFVWYDDLDQELELNKISV